MSLYADVSLISGQGLFTNKDIKKGQCIVAISSPMKRAEKEAEKLGFPIDSVIFLSETESICDSSWITPFEKPLWYFQNHATGKANSKLVRYSSPLGQSVRWVALKKIPSGSEITFNYQPGTHVCFG